MWWRGRRSRQTAAGDAPSSCLASANAKFQPGWRHLTRHALYRCCVCREPERDRERERERDRSRRDRGGSRYWQSCCFRGRRLQAARLPHFSQACCCCRDRGRQDDRDRERRSDRDRWAEVDFTRMCRLYACMLNLVSRLLVVQIRQITCKFQTQLPACCRDYERKRERGDDGGRERDAKRPARERDL